MKPFLIKIVVLLAFAINFNVFTQAQQVNNDSKSDSIDQPRTMPVYRYLEINMKDETLLLKVSSSNSFLYYDGSNSNNQTFSLNASVEKKLSLTTSIFIASANGISHVKFDETDIAANSGSISFGVRYYFMKKKQIMQGISGNNLNGLYIDLKANSFLSYLNYSENSKASYISNLQQFNHGLNTSHLSLWAGIGLQKKLNNWSFIDCQLVTLYSNEGLSIGASFEIGLAWGK